MRKITLSFLFLFLINLLQAQNASTYSFTEGTETYSSISGTASTATGDDGTQNGIPIGFTFNFEGINYDYFNITTNGFIQLGTASSTIASGAWTNGLSATSTFKPNLAAFWDDNNAGTGSIQYLVSGAVGSRTLEVEWNNINIGGGGATSTTSFASFKIRLYETTNIIEFVYGNIMASAGALTASIGINGSSTFLSVTPGATATASSTTANNAISSTTDLVGKKYTFTPPPACAGTPAPGNTIASTTSICNGQSVALSLQNNPVESGYTYQWQESTDGVAYTNISGATNATYTATPTSPKYYQCIVTCATSSLSSTSIPVNITYSITDPVGTGGSRCGTGTVNLSATGANTLSWYASQTGGSSLGTGSSFTTPSIASTTTYYVASEQSSSPLFGGKLAPESTWTGSALTNWGIIFNANSALIVNSVDVYSTAAGTLNVKIVNAAGTELFATGNVNITAGGTTTPNTIPLNFTLPSSGTYKILVKAYTGVSLVRGSTNLAFPYTNTDISVTASEWGGSTTGTYYYFYNIKTTGVCSSLRVPVVATVNTPPALALSSNSLTICEGSSSSAVTLTTGASDYDTYAWTPSTGVSGDATSGWVFNPMTTTSYTLTASQSSGSMCVNNTQTVTVNVNKTPSAITFSPTSPVSACQDVVTQLSAIGGTIGTNGSSTVGTATTLTTATAQPTAFCNRWKHYWSQTVFTAADLTAAGVQPGSLKGIKFNITTLGDGTSVSDFRVKIGPTSSSTLSTYTTTGLTEVFSAATYTHAVGINTITFSTPYTWDGVSNIILDIRQTGADLTNNSQTYYTATAGNTVLYSITSTVYSSSDAYAASNPTPTTSVNRLNTTFDWESTQPTTITWSPVTDLYTDSAASTPYTTGTNLATVYFKSSTTGSSTYTVTAESQLGCSTTNNITVNVNPTVVQNFTAGTTCQNGTLAFPAISGGITGTWSPATVDTATAGTATYTFTPDAGQCANAETWSVTVNATVVQNFVPTTVCQNGTLAFPTILGGITGVWSPTSVDTATAGTTTYTFTPDAGQCANAETWSVTVNATVVQNFTAGAVCQNGTLAFPAISGGITGTWSPATVDTATAGTTTYTFTPNAGQCANAETWSVTVNSTTAPTGAASQEACPGTTLANFVVTGTNIVWYDAATGGNVLPSTTAAVIGTTYYAADVANGCESTRLAVTASDCLGTNGFDSSKFVYYPNPVKSILNVSYNQTIDSVSVVNLLGQVVLSKTINSNEGTVDMAALPSGTYILKVVSGTQFNLIKVVKQ